MIDQLGQEIALGDTVIYTGPGGYNALLFVGKVFEEVTGLQIGRVKIQVPGRSPSTQRCDRVIVFKKASVCLE